MHISVLTKALRKFNNIQLKLKEEMGPQDTQCLYDLSKKKTKKVGNKNKREDYSQT